MQYVVAPVFTFIIARNMGLQGYSNTYMLILLLSGAIAVITAQAVPSGNNTSNSTDYDTTTVSIGDGDDKNNTTANTGNDNGKNDTSVNTGGGDDKNNTSANTGNDNGKNDTSAGNGEVTGKDVKHDILIITKCIMHTKVIATLVTQVIQLTKLVIVFVPSLRNPFINGFNNLFAFLINFLVQLSKSVQTIIKFLMPFLELSIILT